MVHRFLSLWWDFWLDWIKFIYPRSCSSDVQVKSMGAQSLTPMSLFVCHELHMHFIIDHEVKHGEIQIIVLSRMKLVLEPWFAPLQWAPPIRLLGVARRNIVACLLCSIVFYYSLLARSLQLLAKVISWANAVCSLGSQLLVSHPMSWCLLLAKVITTTCQCHLVS